MSIKFKLLMVLFITVFLLMLYVCCIKHCIENFPTVMVYLSFFSVTVYIF